MAGRPYVVLSAAVSADGYLDDGSATRLVLSGPEDMERIDELRAGCDAILVGASTIRSDDPALLIRSRCRQVAREDRGKPPHPLRVTLSRSADGVDGTEKFFAAGAGIPLVYVPSAAAAQVRGRLRGAATVIGVGPAADPAASAGRDQAAPAGPGTAGPPFADLASVLADLAGRGIARLLVEGGSRVLSQFLAGELADELQLAVAPFVLADDGAARLVLPGRYPYGPARRMRLASAQDAGDMAVLRYLL